MKSKSVIFFVALVLLVLFSVDIAFSDSTDDGENTDGCSNCGDDTNGGTSEGNGNDGAGTTGTTGTTSTAETTESTGSHPEAPGLEENEDGSYSGDLLGHDVENARDVSKNPDGSFSVGSADKIGDVEGDLKDATVTDDNLNLGDGSVVDDLGDDFDTISGSFDMPDGFDMDDGSNGRSHFEGTLDPSKCSVDDDGFKLDAEKGSKLTTAAGEKVDFSHGGGSVKYDAEKNQIEVTPDIGGTIDTVNKVGTLARSYPNGDVDMMSTKESTETEGFTTVNGHVETSEAINKLNKIGNFLSGVAKKAKNFFGVEDDSLGNALLNGEPAQLISDTAAQRKALERLLDAEGHDFLIGRDTGAVYSLDPETGHIEDTGIVAEDLGIFGYVDADKLTESQIQQLSSSVDLTPEEFREYCENQKVTTDSTTKEVEVRFDLDAEGKTYEEQSTGYSLPEDQRGQFSFTIGDVEFNVDTSLTKVDEEGRPVEYDLTPGSYGTPVEANPYDKLSEAGKAYYDSMMKHPGAAEQKDFIMEVAQGFVDLDSSGAGNKAQELAAEAGINLIGDAKTDFTGGSHKLSYEAEKDGVQGTFEYEPPEKGIDSKGTWSFKEG